MLSCPRTHLAALQLVVAVVADQTATERQDSLPLRCDRNDLLLACIIVKVELVLVLLGRPAVPLVVRQALQLLDSGLFAGSSNEFVCLRWGCWRPVQGGGGDGAGARMRSGTRTSAGGQKSCCSLLLMAAYDMP